ncbi:SOS response-associated peptidase [Murinocardiopsis flavida]|nr:SOS response-associated peptidase [Murinocardiopsis flavida]
MCGRFAQSRTQSQLRLAFDLPEEAAPGGPAGSGARTWPPTDDLAADHNIAPGRSVYAVLGSPPGAVAERAVPPGPRHLATLRWGLVPSWARDAAVGYRMINARSETVAEKPAFRTAFAHRRCLLPADAYYEWQLLSADGAEPGTSPATDPAHASRKAKAAKRPYAIGYSDGTPLALAGLFERWRDPEVPDDDPAAWVWSCAVITAEAAPELGHIHERMPVVVPPEHFGTWLDPSAGLGDLRRTMELTPAAAFEVRQVGTAVNSVRNNGPELLAEAEPEPEPQDATLF